MEFHFSCFLQWECLFHTLALRREPRVFGPKGVIILVICGCDKEARMRQEHPRDASNIPPNPDHCSCMRVSLPPPGPSTLCLPVLTFSIRSAACLQSLQNPQTHPGAPPSRVLWSGTHIRLVAAPYPLCVYFLLNCNCGQAEPLHDHRSATQCLPHVNKRETRPRGGWLVEATSSVAAPGRQRSAPRHTCLGSLPDTRPCLSLHTAGWTQDVGLDLLAPTFFLFPSLFSQPLLSCLPPLASLPDVPLSLPTVAPSWHSCLVPAASKTILPRPASRTMCRCQDVSVPKLSTCV